MTCRTDDRQLDDLHEHLDAGIDARFVDDIERWRTFIEDDFNRLLRAAKAGDELAHHYLNLGDDVADSDSPDTLPEHESDL